MIGRFFQNLYGSVPAEFQCQSDIPASVKQLEALLGQPAKSPFPSWEPFVLGNVTEQVVYLYKYTPSVRNSFKPFFYGRFEVQSGRALLTGKFTTHPVVKAFSTVWFGFVLVALAIFTAKAASGTIPSWAPLFALLMLAGGTAMLQIGWKMSKEDIGWLSAAIQKALAQGAS